jgi:hypothetical protein
MDDGFEALVGFVARITERHRPDRGAIGGSSADRDYQMSTHD